MGNNQKMLTILSQDLFFACGLDDCLELVFIAAVRNLWKEARRHDNGVKDGLTAGSFSL